MRKIFFALSISLGLFLFSVNSARACSELVIEPPEGEQGTAFVANAFGCNTGIFASEYVAKVTFPNGQTSQFPGAANFDENGRLTILIGSPTEVGIYTVSVSVPRLEPSVPPVSDTFEVTEGDEPVPTDVPYRCNVVIPQNPPPQNCGDTVTSQCCPSICPVTLDDGVAKCLTTTPYICDSSFGSGNDSAGIDSAIGCIPFAKADYTTAFFLQWALGIGGGIALFLISISAIKIMTIRGDPKRLQDARDTLSSAIAGLIMIILSVFLIRFLTQTLLELF